MKTIYVEGLGLVEGHFSGIGQYILGILRGMDNELEQRRLSGGETPRIKVIIPYDSVKKFNKFGFKNIEYKRFPLSFRIMSGLHHRNKLPPIDLWCGRGFYLFTRFASMPLLFSSYSIIIYDLSFEFYRQYSDEKNAQFLSKRTKSAVRRAAHIFTISKNAQREIVEFYDVDKDFVTIATPAADQRYFYHRDQKEIEAVKQKYGIEGDYILALSNLEPRKNLDGLVDAYSNLPDAIKKKVSLLLVGVNGWKTEKLFSKIIAKVEAGERITRPSHYVKDEDKPAIISGAKLLAYPSHYEGFGMPPLEALACGIPVVCSDNSSLPEVVGDYAKMIDSTDTTALTRAIYETLDDPSAENSARSNGPKQAENFQWEKSGNIYLDKLEELA